MPRNRGYRGSRIRASRSGVQGNTISARSNYVTPSSATRRHEFQVLNSDNTLPINPDEYIIVQLAKFQRTFTGSDDTPPTALTSNNYDTFNTMNGSYISNFRAKVRMQNRDDGKGIYLDIYSIAVSFYDVLVWDTVYPGQCPFTFTTDNTTPSQAGQVLNKTITDTLVTDVNYKAFKGVQHYMKKLGTVYLTSEDSATPFHDLILQSLPAKCRRVNLGMFYGLIIANDTKKNDASTAQVTISSDISFVETPSEERLPWQP